MLIKVYVGLAYRGTSHLSVSNLIRSHFYNKTGVSNLLISYYSIFVLLKHYVSLPRYIN